MGRHGDQQDAERKIGTSRLAGRDRAQSGSVQSDDEQASRACKNV
jgi:hypothetical protein